MASDHALAAIDDLNVWFDRTGLAGFDPYDIRGNRRFYELTAVKPGKGRSAAGTAAEAAARLWPRATRRALRVGPRVNSKGVGLYLASQVRLDALGVPGSAERARGAVDWLLSNRASGFPGASWGYPFAWYSRIDFPEGTPSSVATSTVADALLDYAEATGDQESRDAARGAVTFILEGLDLDEFEDGSACFSYTPLDAFHVYNSSLMTAEFLLRAADVFDEPSWADTALRALLYVVREQAPDGSFEYWGEDQRQGSAIDNYHTGFVLRSLLRFDAAGYTEARDSLERGWSFYRDNFFSQGVPLQASRDTRTLNIHSCAEAVLCPAVLSGRFDDALGVSRASAAWTVSNMRNSDGTFVYARRGRWKERMVYWRWSQAWMLRALSELALVHGDVGSASA